MDQCTTVLLCTVGGAGPWTSAPRLYTTLQSTVNNLHSTVYSLYILQSTGLQTVLTFSLQTVLYWSVHHSTVLLLVGGAGP